jgi:hypothetical protein
MWTAAFILNVVHLVYHQVTTNFDFFPFNNIRNYRTSERIAEAAVNALTMGFPVLALCLRNQKMTTASCWVLGFLVVGEFFSWWPYYFRGTPQWMRKWQEVYDRTHKHTLKFPPPIKDHPIPNLEHCILHAMTLSTLAVMLVYYFGLLSARGPAQ